MKKNVLQIALIFSFFTLCAFTTNTFNKSITEKETTTQTKYEEGWKDGHCEGWREEKGQNAYCPYAPYAPYPAYPKSSDSYRDGYNDGYRRGMSDARK
jgi:hypothetical protein